MGLPNEGASALHMIFEGNPGTGKTTVARLMGRLFKAVGTLKRGHLVEVGRSDLVGAVVGETAIKTQIVVDRAVGGVLFIDEAYSLVSGSSDAFGKEALETVMRCMEDMREELVVILAGYPSDMQRLLQTNTGLPSRFPTIVRFPDYTGQELCQIALGILARQQMRLSDKADERLRGLCEAQASMADPMAGNARFVRNLLEKAGMRQAQRLIALPSRTREQLTTLEEDDFGIAAADLIQADAHNHHTTLVLAPETIKMLSIHGDRDDLDATTIEGGQGGAG